MKQRASDGEREQTAEMLREAAGEGRITLDELDERLQSAYRAKTRAELAGLTADLTQGAPAMDRVVSITGGAVRSGRWKATPACRVHDIAGGVDLDLGDADRVEIHVKSIMARSTVFVSDGLNVEISETGAMGTNTIKLGDRTPDPGGPTVHLKLFSMMGGTDVKRGRKRSLRDRLRRRGTTSP